jgi:hypothetical protein
MYPTETTTVAVTLIPSHQARKTASDEVGTPVSIVRSRTKTTDAAIGSA